MESVFLFCAAAHTGPDGKLDIHGVFNELYAPDFPARQDEMVLVGMVVWQRDLQGRIPFNVDLTGADGLSIFSIEGHTDVDARAAAQAPAKSHFILPLKNVMFPTPGHYGAKINLNGREVAGPTMHLMRS